MKPTLYSNAFAALLLACTSNAFLSSETLSGRFSKLQAATLTVEEQRLEKKKALLGLLGRTTEKRQLVDPVLADPETKEPLQIVASGTILGGTSVQRVKYDMRSSSNQYSGSSDTFLNLLQSADAAASTMDESSETISLPPVLDNAFKSLSVFIPPPLRSALATAGAPVGSEYVPMRDLFTSPAVSFAYERGWRQGFAQAGFPGADAEYEMAREYFAPAISMSNVSTVIDMSCATGLFTRRFAKSGDYSRVVGCDYSESMLTEARRRILAENIKSTNTQLDLVRCDVGNIPLQSNSIPAFHAGAAMHCWPDLEAAVSEIYRVLQPGGRYFATTFLSQYFGTLQASEGGATGPSRQAFQYFESVDQLRKLLESGGFEHDKIQIEVLGAACVVIRCEK